MKQAEWGYYPHFTKNKDQSHKVTQWWSWCLKNPGVLTPSLVSYYLCYLHVSGQWKICHRKTRQEETDNEAEHMKLQ